MSAELELFGQYFKELRIRQGKTLRQFCLENDLDPGNVSRLERGRAAPPQARDKQGELARALGLKEGTEDWHEFFSKAAVAQGKIPEELLSDEEVLRRLPLVFRTLGGKRVDQETIERLIELVRRN